MKGRFCICILLLTSVSATIFARPQGEKKPRTDADYRARTLCELTTLLPETFANSPDYKDATKLWAVVHGELLPSRVKVVYDGITRPVVQTRKNVIKEWANSFAGVPEFYTVPYETEMLFTEGSKNHWLVVKTEVVPQFEQELKKGMPLSSF